ncbi:MAG: PDZ domain-containing protein, partial [Gemmataceae bacterium]|nr:PDZ domain-containing protein [Gemmataceae bacterium]
GVKPPVRVGRILRLSQTEIVTDCTMMGGDSGGPLFDLQGRVIGLNSKVNDSVEANVHVPIDIYRRAWKRLLAGEDWGMGRGGRGGSSVAYQPGGKRNKRPGRRDFGVFSRDSVRVAFAEATRPLSASVARVLCDGKPVALATAVDADGLLVTKLSVLKGKIECVFADRTRRVAEKAAEDAGADLAVLRVEGGKLKPVEWKQGVPPQGSLVAAAAEKGAVLAMGTATAEPRAFRLNDRPQRGAGRAFLGVGVAEEEDGLRVERVTDGSGADKAGVREGDFIKRLDGARIATQAQLQAVLGKLKAGDKVAMVVERNGKDHRLSATLGSPAAAPPGLPFDKWGGGPFSVKRFVAPKVLPADLALSPGDCGGPVVDTSGEVVGVAISRALRVSTYVLLPEDIERVVAKARR